MSQKTILKEQSRDTALFFHYDFLVFAQVVGITKKWTKQLCHQGTTPQKMRKAVPCKTTERHYVEPH
jgi:hypothetical protein